MHSFSDHSPFITGLMKNFENYETTCMKSPAPEEERPFTPKKSN